MTGELLRLLGSARVFDLSHPYAPGMPHFPTHPPFVYGLTKLHGEIVWEGGVSSASDAIALGSHVGTHIDALSHFSVHGCLHGGVPVEQSYREGMGRHAVTDIAPILRRGVLLDIAGLVEVEVLAPDFLVTPEHLEAACERHAVAPQPGDVVLLRTGWARHFGDAGRFLTGGAGAEVRNPGPELAGGRWLSGQGAFAVGSDTIVFERVPSPGLPVHVHLLVESGIHILEVLNLEDLADAGVHEFAFVAAPMPIRGATGAPIRPLAIAG